MLAAACVVILACAAPIALLVRQRGRLIDAGVARSVREARLAVDAELAAMVAPIIDRLRVEQARIALGEIALDDARGIHRLLAPQLAASRQIGSAMYGDVAGRQVLVMRFDAAARGSPLLAAVDLPAPPPAAAPPWFLTRDVAPASRGEVAAWALWPAGADAPAQRWETALPGYDPRQRPWHQRALARYDALGSARARLDPAATIAWTQPYTMFTTKTPGISASLAAQAPDGTIVIAAYDLLLDDVAAVTRRLRPTPHTQVLVVAQDGATIGLPAGVADAAAGGPLRPYPELGPIYLAWSRAHGDARVTDARRFTVDGATWWGQRWAVVLDGDTELGVIVLIPEDDLLEGHRRDRALVIAGVLASLLVALLVAALMARRASRRLTELVARSQRIGQLDLRPSAPTDLLVRELRDLDGSLEVSRRALADHIERRDRALAGLAAEEARYRTMFEHAPVGIAHLDLDGRLVRGNARLCTLARRAPAQLVTLALADLLPEGDHARATALLEALRVGTLEVVHAEASLARGAGPPATALLTLALLRDGDGAPLHYILVVQDVSELRALEQQLRQVQKLEAVGQLAGGVAHDFNNVLTAISACAHVAAMTPADDPERGVMLAEIQEAVARGAALTRQLLTFSRRNTPAPEAIDPGVLLTGLERMLRRLLPAGIELVLALDHDGARVTVDPTLLEQVMLNLVLNARDAIGTAGRIEVTVARGADEAGAPGVRMIVRDDGAGIADDVMGQLFDPFFTTKEAGLGTGLGLATCYGIVRQAGGTITAASPPGEGAAFTVWLPRAPTA